MGCSGVSKSQVSRLCAEIDERVQAFLGRPIEGEWPYLWLDATYVKARRDGQVVSVAVIVAAAVNTDGRREVLGMTVGNSEAEPFWTEFLRSLARRGLRGVKLVISDAHEGLKAAITKVLGRHLAALPGSFQVFPARPVLVLRGQAASRTRARRGWKPARPYMVRWMVVMRLIWPAAGLVVQGVSNAACTAARSWRRPAANVARSVLAAASSTWSRHASLSRRNSRFQPRCDRAGVGEPRRFCQQPPEQGPLRLRQCVGGGHEEASSLRS